MSYRVAIGPQEGKKVFTLQTIPPQPELSPDNARVAKLNGSCKTDIHAIHGNNLGPAPEAGVHQK